MAVRGPSSFRLSTGRSLRSPTSGLAVPTNNRERSKAIAWHAGPWPGFPDRRPFPLRSRPRGSACKSAELGCDPAWQPGVAQMEGQLRYYQRCQHQPRTVSITTPLVNPTRNYTDWHSCGAQNGAHNPFLFARCGIRSSVIVAVCAATQAAKSMTGGSSRGPRGGAPQAWDWLNCAIAIAGA